MGLLRWLGDRLDKRDERERLRSVITEIANVLDVEDDPTAVLRGVAGLRDARDYWREEAPLPPCLLRRMINSLHAGTSTGSR